MLERIFKLKNNNTTIKKEILGGLITFFSMSYILFVNSSILSSTGIDGTYVYLGTALTAALGSIIMGLIGNKPFGIAPGMGLNSLFALTICQVYGFSFYEALAITLISAVLYLILTLTKVRIKIYKVFPESLKKAFSIGIGLFIAMVGFISSGIVSNSESTLITLGNLADPKVLISLFGLLVILILSVFKVSSKIIISFILTTIFAIILTLCNLNTGISFNGAFSLPDARLLGSFIEGFKTFNSSQTLKMILAIFSILFLALFNVSGTVSANEEILNLKEDKDVNKVLLADSITFFISGFVGTSPSTTFAESMTGIEAGARTGLANIIIGLCFILAIFTSPLLSIITEQITAPILIMVGVSMMGETVKINWKDNIEGIVCFFTILLMPLTYSITNGIAFGTILYVLLKTIAYRKKEDTSYFKDVPPLMLVLTAIFILYFVITLI